MELSGFNCRTETQHLAFVCLLSLRCYVCVAFLILKMSEITKVTIALFGMACSQTLYFLFKVRRGRVIKNINRRGFIDRQRKGLRARPRELADVFEKNEKKNKTTSVYRLYLGESREVARERHAKGYAIARLGLLRLARRLK